MTTKCLRGTRGELSGRSDDPAALAETDTDDWDVSIVRQAPPCSSCQGIKPGPLGLEGQHEPASPTALKAVHKAGKGPGSRGAHTHTHITHITHTHTHTQDEQCSPWRQVGVSSMIGDWGGPSLSIPSYLGLPHSHVGNPKSPLPESPYKSWNQSDMFLVFGLGVRQSV